MFNPRYPAPVYAAPPGPLTLLSSAVTKLASEMAMAGSLSKSVTAPWNGNCNSVFMGGIDQFGQLQGTLTLDSNGGGTGATPFDDGDDTAAFMLAPGAIMSDVEMYEANYPLLYLFRRQRADSCGHGQMRGGLGGEMAAVIHNSTGWRVGFRGLGTQVATTSGLAGGYPADSARVGYVPGVNPLKRSPPEYAKLQRSLDELIRTNNGESAEALAAPRLMVPGDVYYLAWTGGGGFADPLRRDPQRVAQDVLAGLLSPERCRDTYGVVMTASSDVDADATAALRNLTRKARLAEAEAAHICSRQSGLADRLGNPVYGVLCAAEARGTKTLACGECGVVICLRDADFHDHVPTRARAPASLGHRSVRSDWQTYREHFCPRCGVLLDVVLEGTAKV